MFFDVSCSTRSHCLWNLICSGLECALATRRSPANIYGWTESSSCELGTEGVLGRSPWAQFYSPWLRTSLLGGDSTQLASLAEGEKTFDMHHVSLHVSLGPGAGGDTRVEGCRWVQLWRSSSGRDGRCTELPAFPQHVSQLDAFASEETSLFVEQNCTYHLDSVQARQTFPDFSPTDRTSSCPPWCFLCILYIHL